MSVATEYDVAIVGAGIAGLTAAVELVQAGSRVRVFEARDQAGGRARSVTLDDGATIDLGATWCWSNEPLIQRLVAECGITVFPQWLAGDALFESDRNGVQRLAGNPIDVPAMRFAGGAQELTDRLARQLPEGSLRLASPVLSIHLTEDGQVYVSTAHEAVTVRHVVLALPPPLAVNTIEFRPALPAEVRALANRTAVWMGGMVKVVAVYDDAFWRQGQLAGAAVSHRGPFGEVHDHSDDAGSSPALFGFAPAARFVDSSPEDVGEEFVSQLARLFGVQATSPRSVHVCDWSKERYTSPSQPSPHAGISPYGAEAFQRAIGGRIHWASTETAAAYAGHMEGAIIAGRRVANKLNGGRGHGSTTRTSTTNGSVRFGSMT